MPEKDDEREAARALDALCGPGAALTLLREALRAEHAWRDWREGQKPTPPRDIPEAAISRSEDLGSFVQACPPSVNPLLARGVYLAVSVAKGLAGPHTFRVDHVKLREALASVIPRVKPVQTRDPRTDLMVNLDRLGVPETEIAEIFGVKVQTVRARRSEARAKNPKRYERQSPEDQGGDGEPETPGKTRVRSGSVGRPAGKH